MVKEKHVTGKRIFDNDQDIFSKHRDGIANAVFSSVSRDRNASRNNSIILFYLTVKSCFSLDYKFLF